MKVNKDSLIVFSLLCSFGLFFWHEFYSHLPALLHADWFKENLYLDVLRDAIVHGRIPYEYFISIKTDYTKFFAIPEICLLPDIFLLPYLSNIQFFFIHTSIFFLIGNFGLFLFTRTWSLIPTLFTFLLFNFNGFIVSHLAEGHFQFLGYFTFPTFFWLITNCIKDEQEVKKLFYALLVGLLIGGNFLNGSTHTAVWMCIAIAGVILFTDIKNIRVLFISLLASGLVGAARLIPSTLYFGHISGFITGYPSIQIFIESFVVSHNPYSAIQLSNNMVVGWWEFDFFLGYIGAILVALLSITALLSRTSPLPKALVTSCSILFILSLGNTYELVTQLPISIAKVERISSRFISLPMVALILLFGNQLSRMQKQSKLLAALLMGSGIEIFINASHYFVDAEITNRQPSNFLYIDPLSASNSYIGAVQAGILLSALSILFISFFAIFLIERKKLLSKFKKYKI